MPGAIELTPEQKPKVEALIAKNQQQMAAAAAEGDKLNKALLDELKLDKPDAAKAQDCAAKASKAEATALQTNVSFWMSLRGLLTPEQNKKLSEMLATRSMMGGPPPMEQLRNWPGGARPPMPPQPNAPQMQNAPAPNSAPTTPATPAPNVTRGAQPEAAPPAK